MPQQPGAVYSYRLYPCPVQRPRSVSTGPRRALLMLTVLAGLALGVPPHLQADVIVKNNGQKLVGKILEENKRQVKIRIKSATMEVVVWINKDEIDRIELGDLPDVELAKRLKALDGADVAGHRALITWCKQHSLDSDAKRLQLALPDVEWRAFKKTHRLSWCRTCDARGEITCEGCEGAGEQLSPCSKCDGKGGTQCRVCRDHDPPGRLRCKRCAGKGEIERFNVKTARKERRKCPTCRGKAEQTCPECDGKAKQACRHCAGLGGTPHRCDDCRGTPKLVCTHCNGRKLQPTALTEEEFDKEESERAAKLRAEAKKKAALEENGNDAKPVAKPTDEKGSADESSSPQKPAAKPVGG